MFEMKLNLSRNTGYEEKEEMICRLIKYRDEDIFVASDWFENLHEILEFQKESGSFAVVDNEYIESDGRVCHVYNPTYICCQILMKAILAEKYGLNIKDALKKGLDFSCGRMLKGQGYDDIPEQINNIKQFLKCGLTEFFVKYENLSPQFSAMVVLIMASYAKSIDDCRVWLPYGQDCSMDFLEITEEFSGGHAMKAKVFVYGTLLKGMRFHNILENAECLGNAEIEDYKMYDMGSYPAIRPSKKGKVKGEIYLCDSKIIKALNKLENKGKLYNLKYAKATLKGEKIAVFVYEYLHKVKLEREIPYYCQPYDKYLELKKILTQIDKENYIWYACYGSNLLKERFAFYIQGGYCSMNGKKYFGCSDKTMPLYDMPFDIPYDMYYGNKSSSWGNGGVAFLDVTKKGFAYGRIYLITKQQMEEVWRQEGKGVNWYCDSVNLGKVLGVSVVSFTNNVLRERNEPTEAYRKVIESGLKSLRN